MNITTPTANPPVEILIAEDSSTQAQRLRHILEQRGYRVIHATNGRLALEAAQCHKPTLIISDVVMPEMDGYELCRRVKADASLGDIPLILVTTLSDPEDVIRGLECRADNFILKPYDEHYLLGRVQFVLLNREVLQAERTTMGVEIFFGGQQHFITADRLQILNLLLSTYDAAIQRNKELIHAQEELLGSNRLLSEANRRLEQEIGEREKTEQALRTSEESLAVTLQSIGDAVLATDAEGRVTRLNAVAETLTGWTQAEAAGRPVADVFHIISETKRQPAFLPVADTLAKGGVHGLANHTVLIARDGTERPIADSCAPIRNREGAVIGAVLVFRDVTDERIAGKQIAALLKELKDVKVALDEHAIVAITDAHGKITYVNDQFCAFSKYSREELLGQDSRIVNSGHHPKAFFRELWETITSGRIWQGEIRNRAKDGSFYWGDTTIVPFLGDDGKPVQFIAIRTDTTERKTAEAALQRAHEELGRTNAELAQASRHKDEFLANMSHELRTPLNAILGLSEALLENASGTLTQRQVKSISTISTSGAHLLVLINDILDLSKIEAGRLELHQTTVNMPEFCESCLVFVRTQAMHKHIGITFEPDERLVKFEADPKRLKQILVNLLTNAVKFTPEGGRIGLAVAAPEGEEVVRFTVWDTGIGIAPADVAKLFRAFTQIDSGLSRAQEGTGLGLALVAKLVELHGGSVAFESEPGQGSRFIVTLPRAAASSSTPAPEPAPKAEANRRGYRRALIIEHDSTAAALLVRYLRELGLGSVLHGQGEKSVETALREQPDVILLDILLPDDSGWVVLAKLKEHPGTRDIPVAIVSVVDEPQKSCSLGAAAHFTKPVTRAQLAEFLQREAVSVALRAVPRVVRHTSKPPFAGARLLLAEDNEANIETIGGYLEDKGYEMHYARHGLAAVQLARERHPALILMDIQMPVMDGLAAIREIRADSALKAIPIVALTALAMPGDRERCLTAGATDYLSKPVSLKALAALVNRRLPAGEGVK